MSQSKSTDKTASIEAIAKAALTKEADALYQMAAELPADSRPLLRMPLAPAPLTRTFSPADRALHSAQRATKTVPFGQRHTVEPSLSFA